MSARRIACAAACASALLLAACGGDAPEREAAAVPATSDVPATPALPAAWQANPASAVVRPGTPLVVETGPHTVLWTQDATPLEPPYTVHARLRKASGRLHEGYGIVFGGVGLDSAEAAQTYSYFLVRGDGSFLVKRRAGDDTPVLVDWTRHPAIARDAADAGQPQELEVQVAADSTTFLVNGAQVARLPSAALAPGGLAGLRIAHELVVEVAAFHARPGAPAGGVSP